MSKIKINPMICIFNDMSGLSTDDGKNGQTATVDGTRGSSIFCLTEESILANVIWKEKSMQRVKKGGGGLLGIRILANVYYYITI